MGGLGSHKILHRRPRNVRYGRNVKTLCKVFTGAMRTTCPCLQFVLRPSDTRRLVFLPFGDPGVPVEVHRLTWFERRVGRNYQLYVFGRVMQCLPRRHVTPETLTSVSIELSIK